MDQVWSFDPGARVRRRKPARPLPTRGDEDRELLEELDRHAAAAKDDEGRRFVLSRLGWAFLDADRPKLARDTARRLLALNPRDVEAVCLEGHAAVAAGNVAAAERALAEARLLVQGPARDFLGERLLDLADDIYRSRRRDKPRAKRKRRDRPSPGPEAVRPGIELPAPPDPVVAVSLDAGRLSLPPMEDVSPARAVADYLLRAEAVAVERLRRFETLLALGSVSGVDRYDYQLRTVRRVLRDFRGRVLLADEVGLGKTVEACLCLKEYLVRGLVRRALILVPPALTQQWLDELEGKFGIEALAVDGAAAADPAVWRRDGVLLTSLGLARLERHARHLREAQFDLVIVDEAHRLKNRRTRSWRLVDALRSRFLLLLSATPVENDLFEIYNVLSLLRPGLFSTRAEFKRTFVGPGPGRTPKDPSQLRAQLREVMIRNTRALAEARLPPRFAATLRADPDAAEAALYADVSRVVREGLGSGRMAGGTAGQILRATAACPRAAIKLLQRYCGEELAARAAAAPSAAKDALLADLLNRRREEKVLLFATHRAALDHLMDAVARAGRRPVLFHGSLSARQKERAMEAFASEADVFVASESGGEGFNLQFARTVVNYDLPWNPMRIEQRIGRVHRIGQEREVFVFNLVTRGTLEEEILRVLDEKINMFELVVGEIETILGRLGDDERGFQELVLDIYAGSRDAADLRARFDALAARLLEARGEHERVKRLEQKLFGRDLEA